MKNFFAKSISNLRFTSDDAEPADFYFFVNSRGKCGFVVYRLLWMVIVLAFFAAELAWEYRNNLIAHFPFYLTSWCELLVVIYVIWAWALALYGRHDGNSHVDSKIPSIYGSHSKEEQLQSLREFQSTRTSLHLQKTKFTKLSAIRPDPPNRLGENNILRWFHKVFWFLYEVTFVSSMSVTSIYWIFLHSGNQGANIVFNLYRHGLNCIILTSDALVTRYPAHFAHWPYSYCLGVFYVFFTFVMYKISKHIDPNNSIIPQKIYWFLDWDSGSFAPVYLCIGMLPVTCLIQGLIILLHSIRLKLFSLCKP
uniref:uncharacterized protein LOC120332503 n=1 Tax=Styela clava TaxID=7725 RepID=UPI0019393B2A|nr:uncharacterized protein LOC120332503 [Styela clava]XP_039255694.1 uncharacterized protein LOC120332503 [Styela clava]XP_039255695.1 uncharacterized protein LOC120332503 [Styela clava]